jgi:hypothetical protein
VSRDDLRPDLREDLRVEPLAVLRVALASESELRADLRVELCSARGSGLCSLCDWPLVGAR